MFFLIRVLVKSVFMKLTVRPELVANVCVVQFYCSAASKWFKILSKEVVKCKAKFINVANLT